MAQYLKLEQAAKKLNIKESEILELRATKDIFYSEKTDKYNINSILQIKTGKIN